MAFLLAIHTSKKYTQVQCSRDIVDLKYGSVVMFTLSADSKKNVDDWKKEVTKAGGNIISKPEEFKAGYYGSIFTEPDGHKFNDFYNAKVLNLLFLIKI